MDEWFAEAFPPPKKKKCLSLTRRTSPLQDATNRFAKPVEASVMSEAAKGVILLKTEQSTRWAVNNFERWARSRASSSADTVPLDICEAMARNWYVNGSAALSSKQGRSRVC